MAKKIAILSAKEVAALEKEAQKLMSVATKALKEAGKLAEKGRFMLQFMEHKYYPESVYGKAYDEWESMDLGDKLARLNLEADTTEEDLEDYLIRYDLYKDEYASTGEFWMASHC